MAVLKTQRSQLPDQPGFVVGRGRRRRVDQTIKPNDDIVVVRPELCVRMKYVRQLVVVDSLTDLPDRANAQIPVLV